ncbi:hypothetical protein PAMP_000804 [Pampus punctatissimus]
MAPLRSCPGVWKGQQGKLWAAVTPAAVYNRLTLTGKGESPGEVCTGPHTRLGYISPLVRAVPEVAGRIIAIDRLHTPIDWSEEGVSVCEDSVDRRNQAATCVVAMFLCLYISEHLLFQQGPHGLKCQSKQLPDKCIVQQACALPPSTSCPVMLTVIEIKELVVLTLPVSWQSDSGSQAELQLKWPLFPGYRGPDHKDSHLHRIVRESDEVQAKHEETGQEVTLVCQEAEGGQIYNDSREQRRVTAVNIYTGLTKDGLWCHSSLAQTLPPEEAPVDRPFWGVDDPSMPLPFDLADIINRVESLLWRSQYLCTQPPASRLFSHTQTTDRQIKIKESKVKAEEEEEEEEEEVE